MYRFSLSRDELSDRLGGGLPEGSLVVIEGEFGAGKSILLQRLLYGLVENETSVSLVSTELTTMQFIQQMYSIGYSIEPAIYGDRLLFLPVFPILGYPGRKDDVLDRLLIAKRMYESDVIAIDTLSSIIKTNMKAAQGRVDVVERAEQVLFHFKRLNTRGRTIVLTLESGEISDDISSMLRASADVYLRMNLDIKGTNVTRSIFVRRFSRADSTVGDLIPFRVEPKVGLVVEIKSVA
ncbi:MAG: archaellum protein ArlH [Thermoplasmatota archaeon]